MQVFGYPWHQIGSAGLVAFLSGYLFGLWGVILAAVAATLLIWNERRKP